MRLQELLLTGSLVLVCGIAVAGAVQSVPVTVTVNPDGSGSADGNMATARNSHNTVEFIGCGTRRVDGGPVRGILAFGFCQAASADEVTGYCETENPKMLEALQSITAYSYIRFTWNADGTCRSIGNSTQSFYIP
jgi:hypothetical protein